ncbi:FAD-binding oxidoreductase [Nocardiopsis sp. N85]|uniref:FAD-binding oxidoreductase n=1 Tax=Nocardiopsis sp. N85 TaxID=3029400 RepID=UPI00237F4FE3|nr:FAD-binding oxidoreductase [Nocardiopsis sp. N85]MDE3722969.1 FAD-binding oxidoreductase [Nocardiopsis sp. N85]
MSNLDELRTRVRGRVLLEGDEGFEQARRPWNLAVEQPVSAVVEAADADDVAALVRYAREAGLTVSAQPNGHGASGAVEGVVLLRTGALDEVRVDAGARTARVGAGVSWGRVQAEAAKHGLTGLPGSSPVVSVTGYTLGGGLSWFGRRHGWAADGVTAFEVVDARGERVRVTAASDPDLFWALCGAGGDFALVTAIEFDLYPAPALYGGRLVWPGARAPQVMEAFGRITAGAPEELTLWLDLFQFPGGDPLVAVDVTYLGEEDKGRELLRPLEGAGVLLSDTRGVLELTGLGAITAEPTDPSAGLARAELLTGLGQEVIDALVAEPIAPLLSVQIRHLGGALAGPSQGPFGPLGEPYSLYMFGVPFTPEVAQGVRARQRGLAESLAPHVSGRKPYTYLAPGESVASAFGAEELERLRRIKRERDPSGVFRSNYPVLG